MRRIIGLQACLELSAHTVRSENRADRQADASGWGAGIRTSRLGETRRRPLSGVGRSGPLARSRGGLWATGVKLGNWDDRAAQVRQWRLWLGAAPLRALS